MLLFVPLVFLLGYLALAGAFGMPWPARIPLIVGYVTLIVAMVVQLLVARQARATFPRLRGLRINSLLGVAGTGIVGFIVAAIGSLAVQQLLAHQDAAHSFTEVGRK